MDFTTASLPSGGLSHEFMERLHSFAASQEESLESIQQWPATGRSCMDYSGKKEGFGGVQLECTPSDKPTASFVSAFQRIIQRNRLLGYILLRFTSLCGRMQSLTQHLYAKLLPPLALFGERESSDEAMLCGAMRLLPLLSTLWKWACSAREAVSETLQNLEGYFFASRNDEEYVTLKDTHLTRVLEVLTQLLGAAVGLREVLASHEAFPVAIERLLSILANRAKMKHVEQKTTEKVMRLLQTFLEGEWPLDELFSFQLRHASSDEGGTRFVKEFAWMGRRVVQRTQRLLDDTPYRSSDLAQLQVVGLCGLLLLHDRVFPHTVSEKESLEFFGDVARLQEEIPVVHVYGRKSLFVAQWLDNHQLPTLRKVYVDPTSFGMRQVQQQCRAATTALPNTLFGIHTMVNAWGLRFDHAVEAARQHGDDVGEELVESRVEKVREAMLEGLQHAEQTTLVLQNIIHLHSCTDSTLSCTTLTGLTEGVDVIMRIRGVFCRNDAFVATTFSAITRLQARQIRSKLAACVTTLRERIAKSSEGGSKHQWASSHVALDQLALLEAAVTILEEGSYCSDALFTVGLAVDLALYRAESRSDALSLSTNERTEIATALKTLVRLCRLFSILHAKCSISLEWLYWGRASLFPRLVENFLMYPITGVSLPYFAEALENSVIPLLKKDRAGTIEGDSLVESFAKSMEKLLLDAIIKPLAVRVENDLRFSAHRAVGLSLSAEARKSEEIGLPLWQLTRLRPFRFFGRWFHIASEVEEALNIQFYNLNAINPNDWAVYERMRLDAQERYGLDLVERLLPEASIEQGVDLLHIARDVNAFVSQYTYSLNEQLFVERFSHNPSATYLQTVQVSHVTNAIRTHGIGIMNTTVNQIYKCLTQKLSRLTSFFANTDIQSYVLQEEKFMNAASTSEFSLAPSTKGYPLHRAEKLLQRTISASLSAKNDQVAFVEWCRQMVGEIGNALGLMRTIRSAGRRVTAQHVAWLRSAGDDTTAFEPKGSRAAAAPSFVTSAALASPSRMRECPLSSSHAAKLGAFDGRKETGVEEAKVFDTLSQTALSHLDSLAQAMHTKHVEAVDYLGTMVAELTSRLERRTRTYGILRRIYLLLPAIWVSQVRAMVREGEQVRKGSGTKGVVRDDGVALGSAFLVTLLRLENELSSLHFFDGVRCRYEEKAKESQKQGEGFLVSSLHATTTFSSTTMEGPEESLGKARKGKVENIGAEREHAVQLQQVLMDAVTDEYTRFEEALESSRVLFSRPRALDLEDRNEEGKNEVAKNTM